ncbi:MAG: preprotein translocase subunit SecG [Planctomycetia bacterium]|nr:preprotein translocase subunit SecG [Planctomycetia bacterium]
MFTALLILQVVMALSIIALVLLQQGKGADMGAAFGAGSAGTVFGARGGGSFFTRATAVLAAGFFINSILLSSPLVRDVQDGSASVTTATVPTEALEEAAEEEVDMETIDLPPADLPEVESPTEDAASDVPDMPEQVEEPEQTEGAEQADQAGAAESGSTQ